jgi:hypothetical protein
MGKTEELSTASLREKGDFRSSVRYSSADFVRGASNPFCAEDTGRESSRLSTVKIKDSRQFQAQRMFISELEEDARIPTLSAPSIEANG